MRRPSRDAQKPCEFAYAPRPHSDETPAPSPFSRLTEPAAANDASSARRAVAIISSCETAHGRHNSKSGNAVAIPSASASPAQGSAALARAIATARSAAAFAADGVSSPMLALPSRPPT